MISESSRGSALSGQTSRPASLDLVLDFAWGSAEFTATDAIEAIGLTRSTTIGAIDSLVDLGLLRELPNLRSTDSYRIGRPARRFEFRADAGVLIGIDFGHEHLTVVVTDLRGAALTTYRETLDLLEEDPAERRRGVVAAVDAALLSAGSGRQDVIALCVGVPAPVSGAGRSPLHPGGFWQLMNPDLIDVFSAWAPIVRVENDAYLAAIAEGAHGSAVGCRDYIVLLAGARFGSGVVVDGRPLRGTHGGVGEMAALELVSGVNGAYGLGAIAVAYAREAVARGEGGALAEIPSQDLDGRVVMRLAEAGDSAAVRVVERMGVALGRVVGVLGSLFDPARIVVAGAVSEGIDAVVAAARTSIPADIPLPSPELFVSTLGADVVVTGAIAAAVDAARSRGLEVWLSRLAAV